MKSQIYLREATLDDADLLFEWRNEKTTRENSFKQRILVWDEHYTWLKKNLKL